MNRMEKFTIGQTIDIGQLLSTVQRFVSSIQSIVFKMNLKQKLKHNLHVSSLCISPRFLTSCIKHCVCHQLRQAFDEADFCSLQCADTIRQIYFQMSAQGLWKRQFQFQQAIVCLTKIISQFYSQAFTNVSINSKLQSQIFVILIFTLIGIKVQMACYPILEKKYFRSQKQQRRMRKSVNLNARKTINRKMASRQRQSLSISFANKTNSMIFSYLNQLCVNETKQPIDQFRSTLKESLYINPLPPIKREKREIEQLAIEQQINKNFHDFDKTKAIQRQKVRPFLSTQISLSLSSQIQKRNVSIAEHNKPFRMNHRVPFYSTHQIVFKNNIVNEAENTNQIKQPKQKVEKAKFQKTQWEWTIKSIKEQVFNQSEKNSQKKCYQKRGRNQQKMKEIQRQQGLTKSFLWHQKQNVNKSQLNVPTENKNSLLTKRLSRKSQRERNNELFELNKKTESKQASRRNSTQKQNNGKQVQKQEQGVRLEVKIKNFKDEPPTENENYFQKQQKMVNNKQLKCSKKMFDAQSRMRRQKMEYTMFMLPSANNKRNVLI